MSSGGKYSTIYSSPVMFQVLFFYIILPLQYMYLIHLVSSYFADLDYSVLIGYYL